MANFLEYVLDHDEKTLYLKEEKSQKKGTGEIISREIFGKYDLPEKKFSDKKYIDYKISFDRLEFSNEERKNKLLGIMEDLKEIKLDASFVRKRKLKKKPKPKKNTIKIYKKGDHWIRESNYERYQKLDDCILSLHTNEKHPHFHLIIPRKGSWGNNYYRLRKEITEVMKKHEVTIPDMVKEVTKEKLKVKEYREKHNEYKTARQVLSDVSWQFEKDRSKGIELDFEKNIFVKKYCINFQNKEHSTYVNERGEERKVYSFSKLVKKYITFEDAGSKTFLQKLFSENEKTLSNLENYKELKELVQDESLKEKSIKEIYKEIGNEIYTGKNISSKYRNFLYEHEDSTDPKLKILRQNVRELLKNRKIVSKYSDISEIERKANIKELGKKHIERFEHLELSQKVKKEYKELLLKELKSESNIRKSLKEQFGEKTISMGSDDKQNIKVNGKIVDCSDIFDELNVDTRYQQIWQNKNSKIEEEKENKIEDIKVKRNKDSLNYDEDLTDIAKETAERTRSIFEMIDWDWFLGEEKKDLNNEEKEKMDSFLVEKKEKSDEVIEIITTELSEEKRNIYNEKEFTSILENIMKKVVKIRDSFISKAEKIRDSIVTKYQQVEDFVVTKVEDTVNKIKKSIFGTDHFEKSKKLVDKAIEIRSKAENLSEDEIKKLNNKFGFGIRMRDISKLDEVENEIEDIKYEKQRVERREMDSRGGITGR